MRWSHFVQGQSRIAFLRGRWQHQSAASLPMNPNSVILTQLEYELVMCTHKDIEEPELDLQSWKADDWERQKQIFKLCRKVQKKTPKMSISVQTCRAIRNYSDKLKLHRHLEPTTQLRWQQNGESRAFYSAFYVSRANTGNKCQQTIAYKLTTWGTQTGTVSISDDQRSLIITTLPRVAPLTS